MVSLLRLLSIRRDSIAWQWKSGTARQGCGEEGDGGGWGNPHPKGSASMRDESRVHDT